jgi:anthranilate phosphoribosyltransferase
MSEHPAAHFIRILGKGPRLSRPLTQAEACEAGGLLLRGEMAPEQIGALFCLLRVRGETPAELAGLAQALREQMPPLPKCAIDLDWPSYAGKARRGPLFLLAALCLAGTGLKIVMHGASGHTGGRLYSDKALASLGIQPVAGLDDIEAALDGSNFAYLPMDLLHARLPALFAMKAILGLRSPLHSAIRHLNPFGAPTSLISVFHPNYRPLHRDAAHLLGDANLACFKGDGGEIERRGEKPCLVEGLRGGQSFSEEWPALFEPQPVETDPDPEFLRALWRGEAEDPRAAAVVTGTMALVLRQSDRADGIDAAQATAEEMWRARDRRRFATV